MGFFGWRFQWGAVLGEMLSVCTGSVRAPLLEMLLPAGVRIGVVFGSGACALEFVEEDTIA